MNKPTKQELTCPFHCDLETCIKGIKKKAEIGFYFLIFIAATEGIDLAKWIISFFGS